jgi:hypothetical protein
MKGLIIICAVASIFALGTQVANADLITSSADAALAGATVIDFEDQTMGTYASITIRDVTFTANDNHLMIDDTYQMYNQQGIYLDNGTYSNNGFASMTIDFGIEATAFGFIWGMAESWQPWNLIAYDASNNVLETHALPSTGPSSAGEFYGIAAAGIDHAVLIATNPAYDWIAVDNFTYSVVPVPAAVLLGMLGLSVAGVKLRKFA